MDHATRPSPTVIELDSHPRVWTDPVRLARFLQGRRLRKPVAEAAVRFGQAVGRWEETPPRSWLAPLIASLPERPTEADLEVSVAGAAFYFRYLDHIGAPPRAWSQVCEYDLMTAAHVVEELLRAGFDRDRMTFECEHGAEDKVKQHDDLRGQASGIAGGVTWLGGWKRCDGYWIVTWMPAGGGVAVASEIVEPSDRPQALFELYLRAFAHECTRGRAPARIAVFTDAQERAMRDFAREADLELLPLYRLQDASPLRFWAEEAVRG